MDATQNQKPSQEAHTQQADTKAAAPQQAPVAAPPAPRQLGPVSKAWTDITGHPGWWKRVLLLMFMGIVPFVNFFVAGYFLKWASQTSNSESKGLPRHTFNSQCFIWGFFFFVIGILFCVADFVVSLILMIIPLVGWIISFLFGVFASGIIVLAGIRMVLKKNFTAAFDLSQIVEVIKRDPWHLFLAVLLPALAVGAIICAVFVLFTGIFLAENLGNFLNIITGFTNLGSSYGSSSLSGLGAYGSSALNGYNYTATQPNIIASLISIILGGGSTLLISLVIAGVLSTFGELWLVRSVAHWLCATAPEWFQGKDVPYTEKPVVKASTPTAPTPAATTSVAPAQTGSKATAPTTSSATTSTVLPETPTTDPKTDSAAQ